ncbi:MAG: DUF1338 domain-containing protein [Bdellovibrionaceae bacterium]|nr:DUF1338 domain-containing protein [Pseudobdellovibrionaceae bacterium]MBX3033320.1 DUF1338 domain-containing protein [Pseudobdellovibrionaceae bacterium]
MTLEQLLQDMWLDYCALNPSAKSIYDLLTRQGETVLNDHIAFRTYNLPKVGLDRLAEPFLNFGYKAKGEYHFKEKKLFARHYEPTDMRLPKIFISELLVGEFSPALQKKVRELVEQVPESKVKDPRFLCSGRPWQVAHADYEMLAKESEYAAWMSAFGYRPNHFTVNVNAMEKFNDIHRLNQFLQENGHVMNASGGLVKGSPEAMLEQSSTMAREVPVDFTDGRFQVPACYYEFAKRYPQPNGELYHGFIEKSADKIFESTDRMK